MQVGDRLVAVFDRSSQGCNLSFGYVGANFLPCRHWDFTGGGDVSSRLWDR